VMYTGIVQGLCRVERVVDEAGLRRLQIEMTELVDSLVVGASVAINGTCLTVTRIVHDTVSFDVIGETMARTNLGGLKVNDRVNVERSMRMGDEIGGHVLSGHVAGLARLERIESGPSRRTLWFDIPIAWMPYLFHKGFVALDGASLTIADIERDQHRLSVSLIPETIARTTLGTAEAGYAANLEIDAQAQAVVTTVERLFGDPQWRRQVGI
jgi:riboflavin synthase